MEKLGVRGSDDVHSLDFPNIYWTSTEVKIPAMGVRDDSVGVSLITRKKANSSGVRIYSMISPVKIVVARGLNPYFACKWEIRGMVL